MAELCVWLLEFELGLVSIINLAANLQLMLGRPLLVISREWLSIWTAF